jgi:biopolymer transport protein ExbD
VDKNGDVFWNDAPVTSNSELLTKLQAEAIKVPQPEVHIRGDSDVRFESIGRVMVDLQRSAILKVGFITNPEPKVF